MKADLTTEEMSLAVSVMKEYLADLRSEIHDTDDFKFKKALQEKEHTLETVVSKFEQELVTGYQ